MDDKDFEIPYLCSEISQEQIGHFVPKLGLSKNDAYDDYIKARTNIT